MHTLVYFSARDVIYTPRAYATMSVSVCLSVWLWRLCIVVTGCNGSRIPLHAWIDGCLCYLLTTPHPDRRMGWCRDFWWKRGGSSRAILATARPSCLPLVLLFCRFDITWWCRLRWRFWSTWTRVCTPSSTPLVMTYSNSRCLSSDSVPELQSLRIHPLSTSYTESLLDLSRQTQLTLKLYDANYLHVDV